MGKKQLFSKSVAKEIAHRSFGLVLDCILGYSDTGYGLPADGVDFDQNYEEDLVDMGITPTTRRIEQCGIEFDKLVAGFEKMVRNKYYK